MQKILVATTNAGKIREIQKLFQRKYIEIVGLSEVREVAGYEVEESGTTFAENAAIKAKTYAQLSGLITLADDSGLSVAALNGRPGIQSKRYGTSDEDRINRLLEELKDVPQTHRQAWFTCSIAIYDPSAHKTRFAEGRVDGVIAESPKGTHGFGYDPIFYCPEIKKTFGEATDEEKNQVSHRGRAMVQVLEIIRTHFSGKK